MDIRKWDDIKENFDGALLIGNGASIAVDDYFSYGSLRERAKDKGFFNKSINALFGYFDTGDFELILRIVWHAQLVNEALDIQDDETKNAYEAVRDALIQTIRDVHCLHALACPDLPGIYSFTKNFKTVCSLNYDLILYWAVMYGNEIKDGHIFKDCFPGARFRDNWRDFRQPIYDQNECTLVFYPHGNLVFARDKVESEVKIESGSMDLLETILQEWGSGRHVPLFVSEGTKEQKVNSINSSHYLRTVYREVLHDLGNSLVVYGWGFGEHDLHILERICQGGTRRFAVSVFDDGKAEAYCNRVQQIIRDLCPDGDSEIIFFDANDEGCWNILPKVSADPKFSWGID